MASLTEPLVAEDAYFQVGRIQCHWKCTYQFMNIQPVLANLPELTFHVVQTLETNEDNKTRKIFSIIPATWFGEGSFSVFLYPSPSYVVKSKHNDPMNWSYNTFNRHRNPCSDWMEYDGIIVRHPKGENVAVDHITARKIQKNCFRGRPLADWTDSSKELPRKRKPTEKGKELSRPKRGKENVRKRTVVASSEEENPFVPSANALLTDLSNTTVTSSRLHQPWNRPSTFKPGLSSSSYMMNGELLNGLDHISHECHPMRNHAAAGSSIQQSGLSSTAFTLRGEMAYEANRAYYENQGLISSYVHRDMAYEPHRANYDGNSIQTRNFTSGEASIQPVLSSSYTVNEGLPVHESNGENNSSNPTLPAVQSYEPDPLRVNVQTSNLNGGVVPFIGTYGYLEDKINSLSTSLQEVKDLLKKIVLMIQKSLQTPEKFLNKNVKYFEEEVKELIQNMPFDEVEQLVALEKVLMGEKHSRICMVCYLVNHFKTANTQAIFVSQIWRKISTDKLMQVLQWKSGRGDDQRNGISQMIHLVSVIGVSLGLYCQNKKIEEPSIVELKDFIQKARSQGGARFRTANKISHSAAMNNHRAALEEDPDSRAESAVLTSTIKSLVSVLSSDVKAFQFQSAPSATH